MEREREKGRERARDRERKQRTVNQRTNVSQRRVNGKKKEKKSYSTFNRQFEIEFYRKM